MLKLKYLITNLLLLFVTIVICILVAEFVLRLMYPVEHSLEKVHMLSDFGVFMRQPNIDFKFFRTEFSQDIYLNSQGLRDYEYSIEKTKCRIAMVGDSFTEGYQVGLNETIPKILENKLNNSEVINFGFHGYGLIPEAVIIEEKILDYNPDIIILNYFAGNDLDEISAGAYNEFPDSFWSNELHKKMKSQVYGLNLGLKLRSFLTRNSMVYYFFKKSLIKINNPASQEENTIYKVEYSDTLKNNLNTTFLIFDFLNKVTTKNNITFIVVLIPSKGQVDSQLLTNLDPNKHNLNKPQTILIPMLDSLQIAYIDLLPELKKLNINNTFYWTIDGHFNKIGYKTAADLIYNGLNITNCRINSAYK